MTTLQQPQHPVLATAADVAGDSAARDVAAWLHHHTHQRPETLRADLRLAEALDRSYGLVAAAMRAGACCGAGCGRGPAGDQPGSVRLTPA